MRSLHSNPVVPESSLERLDEASGLKVDQVFKEIEDVVALLVELRVPANWAMK